jgi:hypothetical protein
VAAATGPHFRYEEEALYPALVGIFGQEYVGKLLADHDRVIGAAERLVVLSGQDRLSDAEVAEALGHVRGMLPHVSDCEGLSIMVERFPDDQVECVLDARPRSLSEGRDLITWARDIRERPAKPA